MTKANRQKALDICQKIKSYEKIKASRSDYYSQNVFISLLRSDQIIRYLCWDLHQLTQKNLREDRL